jgi:uncharacterized protein YfaP (DUF2135 family)
MIHPVIKVPIVVWIFTLISFFVFTVYSADEASVKFVIGTAEVQSQQQTNWRVITLNSSVVEGDRIKTALNSRVELNMPDGTELKINENTVFEIKELKTPEKDHQDKMKFTLWAGNIWAKFKKILDQHQEREIDSPAALVAIRGTIVEVDVDVNQRTLVRVEEGTVSVKSKDVRGEVTVGSNQETIVERGKPPLPPRATTVKEEIKSGAEFIFNVNMPPVMISDPSALTAGVPISGQVTPGTVVSADDMPFTVTASGSFSGRLKVNEGLNTVQLVAQFNGQSQNKELKIYVDTKKPELSLSSPLVAGYFNHRDYSLSGGVFDLTPGDKVKVYINNEEVAEIIGRGSFNRTIILNEGKNVISVVARDRVGNTAEISQPLFLDTVKPILTITEPTQDNVNIYQPPPPPNLSSRAAEQTIRGVVIDPEPSSGIKRIVINGKEIKPNSDGTFETTVPLQRGENRLTFMVEDLAGNILRDNSKTVRLPQ